MSKPIKSGDLVMVMSVPCKCSSHGIGYISTVNKVFTSQGGYCIFCNHFFPDHEAVAELEFPDGIGNLPISCLKKIPPREELETNKHHDEVPA